MTLKDRSIYYLLCCMLLLSSCVNLKSVQDYSNSSITSIKKFEELNYSFTKHCSDRCLFESVRLNTILRDSVCNCEIYDKADTATATIYRAISAYFTALNALSQNELTNYTLAPVEKAIKESEIDLNGRKITITGAQVSSYSNIATLLLRATTNAYRHKKIRQFIREGNQPVTTLLAALQQILTANLGGTLTVKKERLNAFYREIVLDASSSIYERRKATLEFYKETADVNTTRRLIATLVESLQKVSEGHQQLNNPKLSIKELKERLTPISSDIKDLVAEFNTLKNSK